MFNVMICGTPGTGKSTLVEEVRGKLGEQNFHFINLSKFAIENECTSSYDEQLESHEIDEERLVKKLEPVLKTNQHSVVEAIEPDMLPANLFDLVFVCRTDNTILYDRLKERNYNDAKISENVSAEIFQLILDEARDLFERDPTIVIEIMNNHIGDLETNAKVIVDKIQSSLVRRSGPV